MRMLINRLSSCKILLFFTILFTCQLYMNNVEAGNSASVRLGQEVYCNLINTKKDGEIYIDIYPLYAGSGKYTITMYGKKSKNSSYKKVWVNTFNHGSAGGTLTFRLGNDHYGYKIILDGYKGDYNVRSRQNVDIHSKL